MAEYDSTLIKEENLPLLSPKREKELGTTIRSSKSKCKKDAALIELVQHNLRLVLNEAQKYARKSNLPVEELYNAGRTGLIRAAYDYNPLKYKTRFSTYATPWIRQKMRELIHGNSPVKIPLHIINGVYKKNKAIEENGNLTDKELRKELDLTEIQLEKINKAQISSISMNMPLPNSKGGDDNITLSELIPDESAKIPGEDKLTDSRYDFLIEAMEELDEMSRDILMAQVLDADKVKLSDLGRKYGITGERVRQVKGKALNALKKKIVYRMSISGQSTS
ncbi:MAG: sigma-70 family RNA polymerase sigma factor, partial [Synergistaceae bacterium]